MNRIGDVGVRHLADALNDNKVITYTYFHCIFLILFNLLSQTLTELDLSYNQIEDQGIEYLENVFENNTVCFFVDLFSVCLCSDCNRHCENWSFMEI